LWWIPWSGEMRDLQQWFYQTPFHNLCGWSSLVTSSTAALLHKLCFNMACFEDLTMKKNWALALLEMGIRQRTRKTMIVIQRHSHKEKPQSNVLLQYLCKMQSCFGGKLRT
jgi:hypothetical protein